MIRCVLCLEISEPFDSDKVKKWRVLRRIVIEDREEEECVCKKKFVKSCWWLLWFLLWSFEDSGGDCHCQQQVVGGI